MMRDNTYDVVNGILDSDDGIRFAGFVDGKGRLIMHAYYEGAAPLLTEKEAEKSMLLTAIKIAMREPLEEKLGAVEYNVTVYEKVVPHSPCQKAGPFAPHLYGTFLRS